MAFDVITPISMGVGEVAIAPLRTTLRTTDSNTRDLVKTIDIANNGTLSAIVDVYLVPSGEVAGDTNVLIPNVTISANSMFQWEGVQVLNEGDSIQASSTTLAVCVRVSGGNAV